MELFDWLFIISSMIFFSSVIGVFILTANNKTDKVKVFGVIFAVLMLPIGAILINYIVIGKPLKLIIYVILILFYLLVEFLLDQVFKIDFRSKLSTHVPYIIIEWAACYSLLFGSLAIDLTWGWVIFFFFLAFIIALVYNIVKLKKLKKE